MTMVFPVNVDYEETTSTKIIPLARLREVSLFLDNCFRFKRFHLILMTKLVTFLSTVLAFKSVTLNVWP
jgi:hypothetical protein